MKKAQSDEEENKKAQRLEDAEKAILTIAAKLQEADATIRKQGQQIAELTKVPVASKAKTENMLLQTHLKIKNEQIDGLLLERDLWMTKSREEWEKETPPRQPGFDFSPAATMVPTSPTPASPGPGGRGRWRLRPQRSSSTCLAQVRWQAPSRVPTASRKRLPACPSQQHHPRLVQKGPGRHSGSRCQCESRSRVRTERQQHFHPPSSSSLKSRT